MATGIPCLRSCTLKQGWASYCMPLKTVLCICKSGRPEANAGTLAFRRYDFCPVAYFGGPPANVVEAVSIGHLLCIKAGAIVGQLNDKAVPGNGNNKAYFFAGGIFDAVVDRLL